MARAKYKLGSLIRTHDTKDQAAEMGYVVGVIQRADGAHYELDRGNETDILTIAETDIQAAFREQKPRESKPRKVKKEKKAA